MELTLVRAGGGQKLLSVANSPESEASKSSAEIAKFGAKRQFFASKDKN